MSRISLAAIAVAGCSLAPGALAADEDQVAAGRALVEERCARCHAIETEGDSPLPMAPPLRDIPDRYPAEGLAQAFAEGIVAAHPAMPEFELEPDQISALLAYLEWLGE